MLYGSVYFITAYPPTIRYRTAAAFNRRNRSLKSELISTDSFQGSRRNHQVPSGGEDLGVAQRLPELDVEVPAGILAVNQALHHQTIVHTPII